MSETIKLWAKTAGERRRAELEQRRARGDSEAAELLFSAVFEQSIGKLWQYLGTELAIAVKAYNDGGRFVELHYNDGLTQIVISRSNEPAMSLTINLDMQEELIAVTREQDGEQVDDVIHLELDDTKSGIRMTDSFETVVRALLSPFIEP